MRRASWDQTWMLVANIAAIRSRCALTRVGAVIVDPANRVVATGYNGPPAGLVAEEVTCGLFCPRATNVDRTASYDNCVSVHAEANALLFCDRRDREGGRIYVTAPPCWDCAKLIANSGLAAVHFPPPTQWDEHRDPPRSIQLLRDSGLATVEAGVAWTPA